MSSSNQQSNRDYTPNINRYLKRIDKIIGSRGRTPSPINIRTRKPIETKNLDHYLKY